LSKHCSYSEKKSEMLEVRISYSQKQALLALSRERGESVSETVRSLVSTEVEPGTERVVPKLERIYSMTTVVSKHPAKSLGLLVAGAFSLTFALTSPSLAQDGLAVFAAMDADDSNSVSLQEFMSAVRDEGLIWNPNADPAASRRDISLRGLEVHASREFSRYDRNHDGEITRYEFSGRYVPLMRASFVALDRDIDEMISIDELATALGGVGFDTSQTPQESAEQLVLEFDTDGNQRLDFNEFMARS
jgi:Ca2+-binding EF-hand superfamily protein